MMVIARVVCRGVPSPEVAVAKRLVWGAVLPPAFKLSRSSCHGSFTCAQPTPGLRGEEFLTRQTKALYRTL